jgi:hypothetical protein
VSDDQVKPNLYELSGGGVEVTYATSGVGGEPSLTYKAGEEDEVSFTGDRIAVAQTRLGLEATVVLIEITRAGRHDELTLVVPEVMLADRHAQEPITALAVRTTNFVVELGRTGPRQAYDVTALEGTAKAVEFVA